MVDEMHIILWKPGAVYDRYNTKSWKPIHNIRSIASIAY